MSRKTTVAVWCDGFALGGRAEEAGDGAHDSWWPGRRWMAATRTSFSIYPRGPIFGGAWLAGLRLAEGAEDGSLAGGRGGGIPGFWWETGLDREIWAGLGRLGRETGAWTRGSAWTGGSSSRRRLCSLGWARRLGTADAGGDEGLGGESGAGAHM